ncbi:nuclear protein localization protein 4 homolog [Trichonephila clavipes]|nr:nuclear protein localization protein 4 homolog [Trichonephila clavipes]
MLVAVQSPEGTKRIECRSNESIVSFLTKVKGAFNLDSTFTIYKERNRKIPLLSSDRKQLVNYGIKQGDTLYLTFQPTNSENKSSPEETSRRDSDVLGLEEDKVDTYLYKQNGSIQRERDPKLCQHGPKGKCVHCIPVEISAGLISDFHEISNLSSYNGAEIIKLDVWKQKRHFKVYGCYSPPGNTKLDFSLLTFTSKTILCGDFNAHSKRWNYSDLNSAGKVM